MKLKKNLEASKRHGPLLPKKLQALDRKLELLMKKEKLIRISMYDEADCLHVWSEYVLLNFPTLLLYIGIAYK